jgi:hypothetical protein
MNMPTAPMGWGKSAMIAASSNSTLGAPSVQIHHLKGVFYFFFVAPEWIIGAIAIKLSKDKCWGEWLHGV